VDALDGHKTLTSKLELLSPTVRLLTADMIGLSISNCRYPKRLAALESNPEQRHPRIFLRVDMLHVSVVLRRLLLASSVRFYSNQHLNILTDEMIFEGLKPITLGIEAAVTIGKTEPGTLQLAVVLKGNFTGITKEQGMAIMVSYFWSLDHCFVICCSDPMSVQQAAHNVCPYSHATRGNVDVKLEATIAELKQ
jgi:hypothetical protein